MCLLTFSSLVSDTGVLLFFFFPFFYCFFFFFFWMPIFFGLWYLYTSSTLMHALHCALNVISFMLTKNNILCGILHHSVVFGPVVFLPFLLHLDACLQPVCFVAFCSCLSFKNKSWNVQVLLVLSFNYLSQVIDWIFYCIFSILRGRNSASAIFGSWHKSSFW